MSTHASGARRSDIDDSGTGMVLFAGTMLMLVGVLNVIGGIAAIGDSKFFIQDAEYVISSLNTWGWVALLLGTAQVITAFGVWVRNPLATTLAIFFASLNAIAQLLSIPAYPLWALALFGLDMLIIFSLTVYGGRRY